MSALIKTQIEIEADLIVNALKKNRAVIIDEIKRLKTAVDERNEKGIKAKLPFLIENLTKVSKRKTLEGRYNGYKLGINCNGLGYERKWEKQLNPFSEEQNNNMLIGILKDDNLSLEISQEIVSSNRTNFLKLINKLKKSPMPTNEIKLIKINDKIEIQFNGYAQPKILIEGEELGSQVLGDQLIPDKYELSLKDFLDAEIIIKTTPQIADAIKNATTQIKAIIKQEAEAGKFVNDMANVYEAMRKI